MTYSYRHKRLLLAAFFISVGVLLFRETLFVHDGVPSISRYLSAHLPSSSWFRPISNQDPPLFEEENSEPTVHGFEEVQLPSTAASPRTKAIVASTLSKNDQSADWIVKLLPEWTPAIYVTDRVEDRLNVTENAIPKYGLLYDRGREASVYLSYIINHYYSLPDIIVFIHGNRYQTHNDDPMYDTFPEINNLNLDYVVEEGYTALRCNWKICPETSVEPLLGHEDDLWESRGLWAQAFSEFFPDTTIPTKVASPCCAQFAVSKETIYRWPVTKYEQMQQFIWKGEGWEMTMKMGIVLEYMWHIIFGKPAYWCESAKECYCKKWNLCDLDCPSEGWCRGRIWLKDSPVKFPDGWPEQGQDGKDWPYEGWWNDPMVVENH